MDMVAAEVVDGPPTDVGKDAEELDDDVVVVVAAVAVTAEAVAEADEADEELPNMICVVVWRSCVGGVPADEECPTRAESRPCPGAIPAGKLLGRLLPDPAAVAAASGKVLVVVVEVEVEVEEEEGRGGGEEEDDESYD